MQKLWRDNKGSEKIEAPQNRNKVEECECFKYGPDFKVKCQMNNCNNQFSHADPTNAVKLV